MSDTMHQEAPFPHALAEAVKQCIYRQHEGWLVELRNTVRDVDENRHPIGKGLTLIISTKGYNTYDIEAGCNYCVSHFFIVPAATYGRADWVRWLFDQFVKVETHEAAEHFVLRHTTEGGYTLMDGSQSDHYDERPFPPTHGAGRDPYTIRELVTPEDAQRRFNEHYAPRT